MKRARVVINAGRIAAEARSAAVRGLKLAAEHLLAESRKQVPLEEGTLERSGTASVDPGSLRAAVAYDTPYAVVQHERLDYQHDGGRKAKYLEDPMRTEAGVMRDIIAAEIRRALT